MKEHDQTSSGICECVYGRRPHYDYIHASVCFYSLSQKFNYVSVWISSFYFEVDFFFVLFLPLALSCSIHVACLKFSIWSRVNWASTVQPMFFMLDKRVGVYMKERAQKPAAWLNNFSCALFLLLLCFFFSSKCIDFW